MAFLPFKGGGKEFIQGLEIQIPPVGFVPDYYSGSGELIKSDILFADKKPRDQKWQRQLLPDWYDKKLRNEFIACQSNPEVRDDDLQQVRKLHWQRRLNGVWIMVNGNPVYLTGKHWFYMNWWPLDTGYPVFRENDRKQAYFWQYCVEDSNCGGMIEATKRKNGKTYRAGCYQFEYSSRIKESLMGIQSKTSNDARDQVYMFSIITPFKKLPDFFRPIYDTAQGALPKTELAFRHTSVKGKESRMQNFEGELNTIIDWRASDLKAYDGPKLKGGYIGDEVLKTTICNVYERHGVVKECCMEDGEFIAKMYYTSTVEKDEDKQSKKENDAAEKLWRDSNQDERVGGRTITGLFRYFTPSYETIYWDEYGYPLIEKAKEYYFVERKRLEGDPKALAGYIRRNPFTQEEMFMSDSDQCPFNVMALQDALRHCHNLPFDSIELEVRGDLIWKEKDKEAMWVPNNQNGKWYLSWIPDASQRNKVKDSGRDSDTRFSPLNDERFGFGCDPVSSGKEAEHGSSSAAAAIYRKFDIHDEERSDTFVADYVFDPDNVEEFYEDMIIACFFFGCQMHCEKNKFDIFNYFKRRGYKEFMMARPGNTFAGVDKVGEQEAGTYASEPIIELYINRLKTFWATRAKSVRNKRIIEDALKFRYSTRGKRDLTVATGFTMLAVEKPYEPKYAPVDVLKIFKYQRR